MSEKNKRSVYRIYHVEKSKHSEPFTLCKHHFDKWIVEVGYKFIVDRLAKESDYGCQDCEEERESKETQ